MPKDKAKKQHYEMILLKELSQLIRAKNFNAGTELLQYVSLTRIELSSDYSWAKIYWDSFFGLEKSVQIKALLEKMKAQLKKTLASQLPLRKMPSLIFLYDAQYESEKNIENLLIESPA